MTKITRMLLMSVVMPLLACLLGMPVIAGRPQVENTCSGSYVSTATQQVKPKQTLHPQNVYFGPPLELHLVNFLPEVVNLDALHVISPERLLFSIDRNYLVSTANGLVTVLHNRPYVFELTGGAVSIEPDLDYENLGLTLPSLNALYAFGESDPGCYAVSTATSGAASQGGWTALLRPWQVWRFCPWSSPELLFNAGANLGVPDVDALHIDGLAVEFSSSTSRVLAGGQRIWSQNVYRCQPSGLDDSCTAGDLSLVFDGVAAGLRDLDAYSDSAGLPCSDGDPCTENDVCDSGTCAGSPVTCDDQDACTHSDACVQGLCAGVPVNCDDSVSCTIDTCDTVSGCINSPDDDSCDDGVGCTIDTCSEQVGCTSTPDHDACNDNNPYTTDTCDPSLGCQNTVTTCGCVTSADCLIQTTCPSTVNCNSQGLCAS